MCQRMQYSSLTWIFVSALPQWQLKTSLKNLVYLSFWDLWEVRCWIDGCFRFSLLELAVCVVLGVGSWELAYLYRGAQTTFGGESPLFIGSC